MCSLCAVQVIAEDPKPPQLPQNAQRVEAAQKAIDDLLVRNKELSFISRDGKLYRMDSDSEIVLTTNHLVKVVEYGYGLKEYTGQYTVDTNGVISLTLKRYHSSWPRMALWVSGASYYLHPISGRFGFTMGDRAGAYQTPAMKPFWPFKLVERRSTPFKPE
jgi:hypothetical protein